MSDYDFPEIYVRGEKNTPCIVRRGDTYILSRECSGEEYYGHILYEDVVEKAIDLEKAVVKKEFIVIPRYTGEKEMKALLVREGAEACLMEISGVNPYTSLREGDFIETREKIAYIITGKGEVRAYKSPCSGIVVVVANLPWETPEKYIVVVVSRDAVREITVRKAA